MTTTDPTAIPIEFDPREQRMRGIAYHGNTPFDVPYISEIGDNLWQGGCTNGLIIPEHIEHVVSLYPWEAYGSRHQLKSNLAVTMYDSTDEPVDREQVLAIAAWVNVCRANGPTLVHCQAGLNRSSLVAATALVLAGALPIDAVALLRDKRSSACLCNPLFEQWVLDLRFGF